MADASSENPSEVDLLLRRAAAGDPEAWRPAFDRDRPRLRRMVALRMDRRLQGHFEQLSNCEAAQALGLSKSTASKRYVRTLERLKETLAAARVDLSEL
jgi:hypothetical protein